MVKGRDLSQKKILVTREKVQGENFARLIKKYNGIPVQVPMLRFNYLQEIDVDLAVKNKKWLFFTSVNGVKGFFNQIDPCTDIKNLKFAAVGSKTASALQVHGIDVSFIPSVYNAETLVREFIIKYPDADQILLVQGNLSLDLLAKELSRQCIDYERLIVYETIINQSASTKLNEIIAQDRLDYLTFASPSAVGAFVSMLTPENELIARELCAVCIGNTTGKAAKELDFMKVLIANPYTIEGMIKLIALD